MLLIGDDDALALEGVREARWLREVALAHANATHHEISGLRRIANADANPGAGTRVRSSSTTARPSWPEAPVTMIIRGFLCYR